MDSFLGILPTKLYIWFGSFYIWNNCHMVDDKTPKVATIKEHTLSISETDSLLNTFIYRMVFVVFPC